MLFLKKVLFWGLLALGMYVLLSYHFIYFGGSDIKVLKKSTLTLKYTFFSAKGREPKKIISIDELREDGIADLLLDIGKINEAQRDGFMARYETEEDEDF